MWIFQKKLILDCLKNHDANFNNENKILSITGTREPQYTKENVENYKNETKQGSFSRVLKLNDDVDLDNGSVVITQDYGVATVKIKRFY